WLDWKVEGKSGTEGTRMRVGWEDGTSVQIGLYEKWPKKSMVAIQREKLPDRSSAEEMRRVWSETLDRLGGVQQLCSDHSMIRSRRACGPEGRSARSGKWASLSRRSLSPQSRRSTRGKPAAVRARCRHVVVVDAQAVRRHDGSARGGIVHRPAAGSRARGIRN